MGVSRREVLMRVGEVGGAGAALAAMQMLACRFRRPLRRRFRASESGRTAKWSSSARA